MANNTLRMSGLNSGLDTEAIVNALTMATKNKINKNQRTVLKLQAQQEAYRTIIDKFNAFKNKYLDILNIGTCLKSKTMFNNFKSKLVGADGKDYIPGVTASSSANANAGTYHVKVNKVATQTKYSSSGTNGSNVNFDDIIADYDETGESKEYGMAVKVGEMSAYVTFKYEGDMEDVRKQINEQLAEAFGKTNSYKDTGLGRVYLDAKFNEETGECEGYKFVSTDKSSVNYTKPTYYSSTHKAELDGVLKTGRNSFTITVDGVEKTVSFQTVSDDYFDYIFDGSTLLDDEEKIDNYLDSLDDKDQLYRLTKQLFPDSKLKRSEFDKLDEDDIKESIKKELTTRVALFKEVVENKRQGEIYESYEDWWKGVLDETDGTRTGGLDEDEKRRFAQELGAAMYQDAKKDIDDKYQEQLNRQMALEAWNAEYADMDKSDPDYKSFSEFYEENKDDYEFDADSAQSQEFLENSKVGKKIYDEYQSSLQKLKDTYDKQAQSFIERESKPLYKEYFEQAKQTALDNAWDEVKGGVELDAKEEYIRAKYDEFIKEGIENGDFTKSNAPSFYDFVDFNYVDDFVFDEDAAKAEFEKTFKFTDADFAKKNEDGDYIYSEYEDYLYEKDQQIDSVYGPKYKELEEAYNTYFDKAKAQASDEAWEATGRDKAEEKYIKAKYDEFIKEGIENGDFTEKDKPSLEEYMESDYPDDFDENNDEYSAYRKEFDRNFKFTDNDFEKTAAKYLDDDGTSFYEKYQAEKEYIENFHEGEYVVDINGMSDAQRSALCDKYKDIVRNYGGIYNEIDEADSYYDNFINDSYDWGLAREAAYLLNKANIENNLNGVGFYTGSLEATYERDGTLTVNGKSRDENGELKFSITANKGTTNDFGFEKTDVTGSTSQVNTTSKLNELGLDPDENGNYSFTVNGIKFTFSGDTTVNDMMKKVSATAEAGVKMSYSALTNEFTFTASEYGADGKVELEDGGQGLLAALGFSFEIGEDGNPEGYIQGTNTELEIDGKSVETNSNSYTIDGTTYTFTQEAEGQEFTNEVTRDYSKAIETIKSFVEDYNKLIDDIYGYVDDEPNKDYYFLTDDDLDEMELSESQQNKWEKLANKGILYRDSTLTDIMSRLRMVLYNSVDAADGKKVGLFTLGITTSSDYREHGKLVFDENKNFEELFEQYADEITELFTNTEKGIAYQLETVIDNAVRTTGGPGERGTLVDKAGVAGTTSATSNSIYNQIKNLKTMIANLQRRYEQQQDRYWKIYSNMETMLGNLNGQTSYINQLMGNM